MRMFSFTFTLHLSHLATTKGRAAGEERQLLDSDWLIGELINVGETWLCS
jgi:hypothetical protein